jgi:hypothetical protein
MTTTRQLRALRSEWRTWSGSTGDLWARSQNSPAKPLERGGPHIGFSLTCPTRCGNCEACAVTAYRAGRCAEIAARADALKAAPSPPRALARPGPVTGYKAGGGQHGH